jgi:single-strand DNA-binding protein
VCGSIQSRNWQDKEGNKRTTVEVIADDVQFVERKSASDSFAPNNPGMGDPGPSAPPSYSTSYESAPKFEEISADDDLPF